MAFWIRLNSTQHYQVFFFLTAVLPLVLLCIIFLQSTYFKFNEQMLAILNSGELYVEDSIRDNFHELQQSAEHAAALTVERSYHEYLRGGGTWGLHTQVDRYRDVNTLALVMVTDRYGKIVETEPPFTPYNPSVFQYQIAQSLKGKTLSGFTRFLNTDTQQVQLAYVCSTPIHKTYGSAQSDGVLVVGKFVRNDSSLNTLNRVIPNHLMRLVVLTNAGPQVERTDGLNAANGLSMDLIAQMRQAQQTWRKDKQPTHQVFSERLPNGQYYTHILPLPNTMGQLVGYITLSIPKSDWHAFARDNRMVLLGFSLLSLVLVILAGSWFKRCFMEPMHALNQGFQAVRQGNLKLSLPLDRSWNREVAGTVQAFNALVQRLDENERLRANFIYTLTHDLKTPLLAQQRVTRILEDWLKHQNDPEMSELARGLTTNNDNLLVMINQLLDTYRLEEGQIVLHPVPVQLADLVNQCIAQLLPLAQERQIAMRADFPPDFPVVRVDSAQMRRVFTNLLSNAIENIAEGCSVSVQASMGPGHVTITVADNGPGIHPQSLPHVFQRYYLGHKLKKKIGTGLGLYICKMIITQHGGQISVDSAPERGTQFFITLPLAQSVSVA